MKIRFIKQIAVESGEGTVTFELGDVVTFDYNDAYQLIKGGYAEPFHSFAITKALEHMNLEDVAVLNGVVTEFDGKILEIKRRPKPFEVTQCLDTPAPHGNCCNPSPKDERGFRQRYVMKVGPDGTLGVFCLKGGAWCPHAESRKAKGGDEDMIVSEKEKAVR